MKILAMANTYYMLLVVIRLRTTVFRENEVDLIFTDACANSKSIYKKIEKSEIFSKTQYLKLGGLTEANGGKIRKCACLFKHLINAESLLLREGLDVGDFCYDRFLCYAAGRVEEQLIYNEVLKFNPNAKVELYEESYVSYYAPNGIMSIENKKAGLNQVKLLPFFMSLLGKEKSMIENNIEAAWVFEPNLIQYDADFKICAIPKMDRDDREIIEKLNNIFDYEKYRKDFDVDTVFLEDSWHLKSARYGDLQLVKNILDLYGDSGKDQFLVKLHPRSGENRFNRIGIKTNGSSVPLELIVLNSKNTRNIYLSIGSGAPLVCLANFEMKNIVIMLYRCCTGLVDAINDEKFDKYMADLKKVYPDQLFIPENMDELRKLLWSIWQNEVKKI